MNRTPQAPLLAEAAANAAARLLDARDESGHWTGRLSSSALSTATACFALARVDVEAHADRIRAGLTWLAESINDDGGWGDTPISESRLPTTLLAWSALTVAPRVGLNPRQTIDRAEALLVNAIGGGEPSAITHALREEYGDDKTFAAPILMMTAMAGRLGPRNTAWRAVPALPFEWAGLSHDSLRRLGLPIVSYALPALIAVGQVVFHHHRPWEPIRRYLRGRARGKTLERLAAIQPASGGYLEATPLTSFVVMSLAEMGLCDHEVVRRGVAFLTDSMRDDGDWPIDTNLATGVTTLSIKALSAGGGLHLHLNRRERATLAGWLVGQQYGEVHPYTGAAPGGWAWTDLPGGVPDADDTAGALVALKLLGELADDAAWAGARWLLGLTNRDGGVATFCRGWGRLRFDRSCPDITAHAVTAWLAWREALGAQADAAVLGALEYLAGSQDVEGAWTPLWFGNEAAGDRANRVYGTSRVLEALAGIEEQFTGAAGAKAVDSVRMARAAGALWLLGAQNNDGGWGGDAGVASSIEETSLAVGALSTLMLADRTYGPKVPLRRAIGAGAAWLIARTDNGRYFEASPIVFYFAELWYSEQLYPVIFATAALQAAARALAAG